MVEISKCPFCDLFLQLSSAQKRTFNLSAVYWPLSSQFVSFMFVYILSLASNYSSGSTLFTISIFLAESCVLFWTELNWIYWDKLADIRSWIDQYAKVQQHSTNIHKIKYTCYVSKWQYQYTTLTSDKSNHTTPRTTVHEASIFQLNHLYYNTLSFLENATFM